MSWPSDGEPRFKVGELEWAADLDAYVYDRAYCCTTVAGFHTASLARSRWSRSERKEAVRNRAIGLAAMLEAEPRGGLVATPLPLPDDWRLAALLDEWQTVRDGDVRWPALALATRLRGRATGELPAGV